jgi:hypothetical protein
MSWNSFISKTTVALSIYLLQRLSILQPHTSVLRQSVHIITYLLIHKTTLVLPYYHALTWYICVRLLHRSYGPYDIDQFWSKNVKTRIIEMVFLSHICLNTSSKRLTESILRWFVTSCYWPNLVNVVWSIWAVQSRTHMYHVRAW